MLANYFLVITSAKFVTLEHYIEFARSDYFLFFVKSRNNYR